MEIVYSSMLLKKKASFCTKAIGAYVVIIFFSAITVKAIAQDIISPSHPFRYYGIQDGLPQSTVLAISEDSLGYLWVATNNGGVAKFDGTNFETYNVNTGLPANSVFSLYTSKNGLVWIGTNGGLCYYNGRRIVNLSTKKGLPKFEVFSILELSDGNLLLGTGFGLYKLNPKTLKYQLLLDNDKVNCLTQFGKDVLFGTTQGAFILRQNNSIDSTLYRSLPGYEVKSVIYFKKNIYVGIDYGVYQFGIKNLSKFKLIGSADFKVSGFTKERENRLWAIGNLGLFSLNEQPEPNLNLKHSEQIVSAVPRTLFSDRNGNIWVGTESGLYKYLSERFLYINESHQLPNSYIQSLDEDSEGKIWLAIKGVGLIVLDKELKPTTISSAQGLPSDDIWELKKGPNNSMWASSEAGLLELQLKNNKLFVKGNYKIDPAVEFPALNTHYVDGNKVWAAEFFGNAFTVENGKVKQFPILIPFEGKPVNNYTIEKGIHGEIYLANNHGLFIESGGNFIFIREPFVKGIESIQNLIIVDDVMWILSDQGIFTAKYKGSSITNIQKIEQLGGQPLNKYIIWGGKLLQNEIWFLHNRGVSVYNLKSKNFRSFGYHEGFTLVETNQKAILETSGQEVWVGTINGIHIAPRNFADIQSHPPKISLSRMMVNGEAVSEKTPNVKYTKSLTEAPDFIELEYDENNIQIQYESVDFDASDMVSSLDTLSQVLYSHWLEGYERQWSRSSPQMWGSWTSLPPGEYTLWVKARNLEGKWTPKAARLSFVILPPFWQTWWFYLLELLFLMSLLGSTVFFNRTGKQKRLTSLLSVLTILVVFEILNATLDPLLENFAGGVPIFRLVMNIFLAGLLKPVESMMERYLDARREEQEKEEEDTRPKKLRGDINPEVPDF